MHYFTHFEDGLFVKESSFREQEYPAGEFADIFDDGLVVVDMDILQVKNALQDGELLGSLSVTRSQIEKTWESFPYSLY